MAYLAVVRNKGGAGVDGMKVGELLARLKAHGADLVKSIQEGRYKPSPVRRVFIPKENGEKRPLGIPTVVDRFVQQAVAQVLSAEYEKVFSDISHEWLASPTDQADLLETVEENLDAKASSCEAGFVRGSGLDMGQHTQVVLAHGKEQDTPPDVDQ